jgi:hypothetical protein
MNLDLKIVEITEAFGRAMKLVELNRTRKYEYLPSIDSTFKKTTSTLKTLRSNRAMVICNEPAYGGAPCIPDHNSTML